MSTPLLLPPQSQLVEALDYWVIQAQPQDIVRDIRWYHRAKQLVTRQAFMLSMDRVLFTGIVAVLSPSMRWDENVRNAVKLVKTKSLDGINTYTHNKAKALRLLETGDLNLITGIKVREFFETLLDPRHPVPVVDTWAARAAGIPAVGRPVRVTEVRAVQEAHIEIADRYDWPVAGTQAVIWEQVRQYWRKNVGRSNPFIHPTLGVRVA